MKIKVVNQRLYLEPPETAEGTRKYLKAEFNFSEEWDEMTKTAFFRGANGDTVPRLLEEDTCTVPAEVLAASGRVGVSVSGTLGETIITTDIESFFVPATLNGGTPSDPEPTLWQEVLDKFEKVSEVEEKVTELDKKCDTIPTRVSQLENNSGFLTEHQDISGKLDAEKLPEAIDTALAQAKESGVFDGKDGANARDRIGIDEWENVLDVTLEKDSLFSADFEHEYKQLYIYIDQSGVTEKICTVTYLHPYSYVNSEGKKINTFASYYPSTSNAFPNVASVWKSCGKVVTRIAGVTNDQKNTTGGLAACLKVWDTSMCNINGIGDSFKGIYPSITKG